MTHPHDSHRSTASLMLYGATTEARRTDRPAARALRYGALVFRLPFSLLHRADGGVTRLGHLQVLGARVVGAAAIRASRGLQRLGNRGCRWAEYVACSPSARWMCGQWLISELSHIRRGWAALPGRHCPHWHSDDGYWRGDEQLCSPRSRPPLVPSRGARRPTVSRSLVNRNGVLADLSRRAR